MYGNNGRQINYAIFNKKWSVFKSENVQYREDSGQRTGAIVIVSNIKSTSLFLWKANFNEVQNFWTEWNFLTNSKAWLSCKVGFTKRKTLFRRELYSNSLIHKLLSFAILLWKGKTMPLFVFTFWIQMITGLNLLNQNTSVMWKKIHGNSLMNRLWC